MEYTFEYAKWELHGYLNIYKTAFHSNTAHDNMEMLMENKVISLACVYKLNYEKLWISQISFHYHVSIGYMKILVGFERLCITHI